MNRIGGKLAATLLAFALVAGACGDDDTDATPTASDDTSEEVEPSTADEQAATDDGAADDTGAADGDSNVDDAAADDGAGPMEPQRGGELTYGTTADGTGFNTLDAMQPAAIRRVLAMTDPLMGLDAEGNWAPALAESIAPNADATVWTLTLRDGPTFHDGVPVDAAAVKANIDAFKAATNVGFVLARVAEVNVLDPLTVEFVMAAPWGAFPYALNGQAGWLVSPDTLGTNESFVGTGPFRFDSWVPGDTMRVVRYEDYYRPEFPYLDAVTFKVIPEASARRAALETGDIDVYEFPQDFDTVEWLENPGDIRPIRGSDVGSSANEAMVMLNTAVPPLNDVRIRRALAHATDRQLIIDTFRSGLNVPASGFIDPVSPFYTEVDYPEFDLTEAARLVEEYEAENGDAAFTFLVHARSGVTEVGELLVSLWNDAGIDVTMEPVEPGADVPRVIVDNFEAITWFQFGQHDPDAEYVFMHSSGGLLNWSNLVDPEIDAAFETGRQSLDFEERRSAYMELQHEMAKELPIIFLDHLAGTEGLAAASHVHDVEKAQLPDGSPSSGLASGSFHTYGHIWIEQ